MIDMLNLPLHLTFEAARQGTLTLDQARESLEIWPAFFQRERREKSEARFLLSILARAGDQRQRCESRYRSCMALHK
jgi:hypothetical protein